MSRANDPIRRRVSTLAVAVLATGLLGIEQCTPEGPGPIGEADGIPEVVFAPLGPDGVVVADLDVSRYQGLWYEVIVDLPLFEIFCTGTTAEYGPFDATTVTVTNRCNLFELDGPLNQIQGFARIVDPATPARLAVNFGPAPTPFGAPYWVIELDGTPGDQPYAWAIVGGPSPQSLFVLSRTPQIDVDLANAIFDRLSERGYDVGQLRFTLQGPD